MEHLHLSQHFLKTNLQFKIQRLESWFIGWRNKQLLTKAASVNRSIFFGRAPLGHVFGYSFFFPHRSKKKAVCLNRSRGHLGRILSLFTRNRHHSQYKHFKKADLEVIKIQVYKAHLLTTGIMVSFPNEWRT